MGLLDRLAACAGRWVGKSHLQDPPTGLADDCDSSVSITPILGGRFIRLDYTWAYKGAPQEGSMLVGCEPGGDVTAHWIDSWHMSDKVMACRGSADSAGAINVLGSYAAPPGPDWGWRIKIALGDRDLHLVMHNITPDGQEYLAVEAAYARP